MKKLKLIGFILHETGADKIITGFLGFMLICTTVIWLVEPEITRWNEALWYCFTVVSTIGFGDVVVHTFVSRVLSIVLSIYAVVTLAIFTGVIVNFYNQIVERRQSESLASLMDRVDDLPKLSREELTRLARQIQQRYRDNTPM